jgi:hypothetical protein
MAVPLAEAKVAAQVAQTTGAASNIAATTKSVIDQGGFIGTPAAKAFYDKVVGGKAIDSVTSVTEPSGSSQFAWKFIVAPENIDWSTSADVNRIPIFGSNQSPVVVGAKSMRDLELGNAMVEGFTRGVTVEGKVQALEDLLNYSLNTSKGFVNVPVYQITANDKQYGSGKDAYDGGYFVIKEVRVKETMRDFRGNTTRAFVDVSFTQIPPYQVDGGRDQATNTTQKATEQLLLQKVAAKADQVNAATASGAAAASPQTKQTRPGTGPTATNCPIDLVTGKPKCR